MTQNDKAIELAKLHVKGNPLKLYNAWDAGSAKAIVAGGAKAIATSSWAVAAAQGFKDGEDLPLDAALEIAARIAATVDVPVSFDFEGGYAEDDAGLAKNITALLETGVVGINFEDRVVQGKGLYPIDRQAARIAAIRSAADKFGVKLIINARTDFFLGRGSENHADSIADALSRANAYSAAGASSFFIPGLLDAPLIKEIVDGTDLPVNVMMWDERLPSVADLGKLGVARISWGTIAYSDAMAAIEQQAAKALV